MFLVVGQRIIFLVTCRIKELNESLSVWLYGFGPRLVVSVSLFPLYTNRGILSFR